MPKHLFRPSYCTIPRNRITYNFQKRVSIYTSISLSLYLSLLPLFLSYFVCFAFTFGPISVSVLTLFFGVDHLLLSVQHLSFLMSFQCLLLGLIVCSFNLAQHLSHYVHDAYTYKHTSIRTSEFVAEIVMRRDHRATIDRSIVWSSPCDRSCS